MNSKGYALLLCACGPQPEARVAVVDMSQADAASALDVAVVTNVVDAAPVMEAQARNDPDQRPPPMPPLSMARCKDAFTSPTPAHSAAVPMKASTIVTAQNWNPDQFFPTASAQIPGHVVGVMWASGFPRGLKESVISQGKGVYWFSFNGEAGEPIAFYDPAGSPSNPLPWRMHRFGETNPWGLTGSAQLVELEVNAGNGRPAYGPATYGLLFASCARADGSMTPSAIQNAMTQSWTRFQTAAASHNFGSRAQIPIQPNIVIVPTWLADRMVAQVSIMMQVADTQRECFEGQCSFGGRAIAARYQYNASGPIADLFYLEHALTVTVSKGNVYARPPYTMRGGGEFGP